MALSKGIGIPLRPFKYLFGQFSFSGLFVFFDPSILYLPINELRLNSLGKPNVQLVFEIFANGEKPSISIAIDKLNN